jgi:hypothetical protein
MLPIKGALRGRRGLKWIDEAGSYAIVANKELHEKGQARKFIVANPRERIVASVHRSADEALTIAQALSDNSASIRSR